MRNLLFLLLLVSPWLHGEAASLPDTLQRIKPGIVAVGTFQALRREQDRLLGTGFVVGRGNHAVTNSHVVPRQLDTGRRETVAIYLPARGSHVRRRKARVVGRDIVHDLCVLRFEGPALRPLPLGRSEDVREGQLHAFTGFPILHALWLYPVTHQGIVSSLSPIAFPPDFGVKIAPEALRRATHPFPALRLDATAYPGNSGSPVYHTGTGRVVGVVNSVQAQDKRVSSISDPTGVTYAIPVRHVHKLLKQAGVEH